MLDLAFRDLRFPRLGRRRGGGGAALPFTRANVIAEATSAGRTSGAVLKVPGVDPLPSGASFSGGVVTVSGNDVVLEDWALNRVIGAGQRCTIRQCSIEDAGTNWGAFYPVQPTGADWMLERCDIFGDGGPVGSSSLILCGAAGLILRYNHFYDYANDGLKLSGDGAVVEFNRFGPARNNAGLITYSAATYYPPDSVVSFSGVVWRKLSTAAAGTTPAEGANWTNLDPHVDQITAFGGSGVMRYNWFEDQPTIFGATQRIRVVRNTGSAAVMGSWLTYGNVMDDWTGAYPLAGGVIRSWTARSYPTGEYAANAARTVFYRATATTTDNPEVSMTNWALDRDINVPGETLWAHNWINDGTSGVFNATEPSPALLSGNKTEAGAAISHAVGGGSDPVITAPATVGEALSYTPPAKVGPAQVFTISGVSATGIARFNGADYTNVALIRVGIQPVAMIDAAGFWYVAALSGVTMEALGGGSYKLRIFDPSGNPMSASVSVVVGSATVTAQANEAGTGPAWGAAPVSMISNNVPFAREYTLIDCVGQEEVVLNDTFLNHALSLAALPLAQNDIVVGFFGGVSNTSRGFLIGTAGYTKTENIFLNDVNDLNAAFGYKVQGPTPDANFTTTQTAAVANNPNIKLIRAYRGAASASYVTASGLNGNAANPPSVTATKDNSIAVVIGVCTRNQAPAPLSAGYGTNSDSLMSASNWGLSIRILEVEIPAGVYDPPAMTFGGTPSVDDTWWAATILLTPP